MFENFKKLTIKGGCFENETELELFKKDAVTVVYGRNGSGKTTIAKRISELVLPEEERSDEYEVSADITIGPDQQNKVFVFDEDFVTNQVKFRKNGINTIVMIGEQVKLDEKIEKKKGELEQLMKEYKDLSDMKLKYDDESEDISPKYFFNLLKEELREDGGWADIDRDLKGNTMKSRVTGDVVLELLKLEEPKATCKELREQVMSDLKLYQQSENAQLIDWKAEGITLPRDLMQIDRILKKNLDSPELTEREKRLMNVLVMTSHYPWHFTAHHTREMLHGGWAFCPLCLREIKESENTDIADMLTHILNKEANEYEQQLDRQLGVFVDQNIVLPVFPKGLNEQEVNAAKVALAELNGALSLVRERIELRKRNLYESMKQPFAEKEKNAYLHALKRWKDALEILGTLVAKFNNSVNQRGNLYNRIKAGNNLLARKRLSALLKSYKQAETNSNKNYKDLEAKHRECQSIGSQIKSLIQRKERTDIALDYINDELSYVFYSKRKLKLEAGNGQYKLLVNDRNVKPSKISVGERNVLALCYFFALIYSGKTDSEKYKSEYLVVIDDPVSSFDYGNRLGVMTLLRYQFDCILHGNPMSRILVLSHDLYSVFDLVKIKNDVCGRSKDEKSERKGYMTLENNELKPATMQNEYATLMLHVFTYAAYGGKDDPDETLEIGIGNIMRRLLEGFSSFCYNKSFEDMLRMEDLLECITPENKRTYYGNFMFRLTLNTESHEAAQVYSLNSITKYFPKDEKVKTAKCLLLFLSYINKTHVEAYLGKTNMEMIENWQAEEKKWIRDESRKPDFRRQKG